VRKRVTYAAAAVSVPMYPASIGVRVRRDFDRHPMNEHAEVGLINCYDRLSWSVVLLRFLQHNNVHTATSIIGDVLCLITFEG